MQTDSTITASYQRACKQGYRLALALTGDPSQSEDLVQEVFLRVLRRRERIRLPTLDAYVTRAVRNAAYDFLRRRQTAKVTSAQVDTAVAPGPATHPDTHAVAGALSALPPEQREVVHLRVYEGHSCQEVARLTGVPLGTVHSRYRYAIAKLRDLLEEVTHEG